MKSSESVYVFKNILSNEFTELKKAEAIKNILDMATHNSVTKNDLLMVSGYLWNMLYEVVDGE